MLFGEPGELSKYSSKFYLVNDQEVLTLKQEYLDYFFACNALVPQEAGLEQEIPQEQCIPQDIDEGVDERKNEHTPQRLAHGLLELPSEILEMNSQSPPESSCDRDIPHGKNITHHLDKRNDQIRNECTPQVLTHEEPKISSQKCDPQNDGVHMLRDSRVRRNRLRFFCCISSSREPDISLQEACPDQEDIQLKTSNHASDKRHDESVEENRPQKLANEVTTSKDVVSNPKRSSIAPTRFDQTIVGGQSSANDSQAAHNKFTSDLERLIAETSGNVLKLMSEASEEMHSLQLIHAIECYNLKIIPVLPLILQCTITFGVGYTERAEILKTVQHLSKKWLIIKTEESNVEILKTFSSLKTPFETDISFQPNFSTKDLALFSCETEEKAIPYAWYFFCHSIQTAFKETKRKVMSMDEVSDVSKRCHISMDEIPKVLSYLHKSGLLLYYSDILPNVIFESASLIIRILSSAILNSHSEVVTNNDGIIRESSLSQVEDVFVEGLFTFRDVVKLLQNLSIIAPVGTQLFCMPTLLRKVPDAYENLLRTQGTVFPLHVKYPVAAGVFEYLLCYLTSEQNEELWPWKIHIDDRKRKPTCLHNNCAELALPGYECTITLLQSSDCIKVCVDFADSQPPFAKIRNSIIAGVKKANCSYNYPDTEIKLGFSCACGSVDFEHTIILHKQDQLLKCSYDSSGQALPLSRIHKLWLEEGIIIVFFI